MLQRANNRSTEYLTVGEAAEMLGVSPWTLRNWDRAGKLKPIRHPKNGYRIYRHEELAAILEPPVSSAGNLTPRIDWRDMAETEHFVQFYEADAVLVDCVSGYIGTALVTGHSALVIATQTHRESVENELKKRGMDVSAAIARGQYVAIDAGELLARFMVDGSPDPALFTDVVGGILGDLKQPKRGLRAFGEMVALLWVEGNQAAAVRLEELWNELAKVHSFTLFCAYPMNAFAGPGHREQFSNICTCHSRVIPAESYAGLSSPDERLRAIICLQQKAQVLEAEIAHRREAEQELRQAKAAAEEASKAKDQFLAVLSHELRTPLTPVLMSVAAMESESDLPPRTRDELAMIRRNLTLETRLIDDLLDLSRVINGKMTLHKQNVDIHPLINNVVDMIAAEARSKSLNVALDLGATHDRVHADSARLHQVLWNLLKNSIKFTPEGGTISVRTRNQESDRVIIEVQDSGIGIEPRALPTIFQAFDQGADGMGRRFGGLGLGLAISKAVVELHDGTISAHSAGKDCGACFSVGLSTTTAAGRSVQDSQSRPEIDDDETRPLRILLVDDHRDTVTILARLLERSGHTVMVASSVIQAIRAAEAHEFDVLLSDIGLPDGSGLDVVRQVRLRHPNVPAIALTGFGMQQDLQNSAQAGFAAHLTKPIDMKVLETTIRELTRR